MQTYNFAAGLLQFIEVAGLVAFSISGVMAAFEKKLDVFGILIIAFITAMGGGTLRDILIGSVPVNWMLNTQSSVIVLISALVAILFKKSIGNFQKLLLLFDSLGLGLFTVVGIEKGIDVGLSTGICIVLGTITACFGGVIRDISLNTIPMIFQKKEIYATVCILGGILYFLFRAILPVEIVVFIVILFIFFTRLLAVRYRITLPDPNKN